MELLMKHIFVPLKGICCLCFGLQHLHQNQNKKKSQNQFGKLQSTMLLKQKAMQRVPLRLQKCQWSVTPATNWELQLKPFTSSLEGWEFHVQHQKCTWIEGGFVGYEDCSSTLNEWSEYAITAWHLYELTVLKTQAYFSDMTLFKPAGDLLY